MSIGKLGVWTSLDAMTSQEARAYAQKVEQLGYPALWIPESRGRNAIALSAWLLSGTRNLVIATGIANIYARDAMATANAHKGLNEQSDGRFLLGLGVSHVPMVEGLRGHAYTKPVSTMRAYLAAMASAPYQAPMPERQQPIVLAALGPRMLELSGELTDGAHPYCTTPEHTALARKILGPGELLAPELMVLLETDPATARQGARTALAPYMALANYANNWRRLGYGDDDFAGGGSDRFVDANVAWGDEDAIRRRIQQHWDAGADHVCIQPLYRDGARGKVDMRILELLAPDKAT